MMRGNEQKPRMIWFDPESETTKRGARKLIYDAYRSKEGDSSS